MNALTVVLLLVQGPRMSQTLDSAAVVRLHLINDGRVEARLVATLDANSQNVRYCPLSYVRTCQPTEVPITSISAVDAQTGNRAGRGFLIGTVVGGLVITPLVYIGGAFTEGETRTSLLTKGVFLSVLIGGGVGLLIGHGSPKWSPAQ